MVCDTTGPTLMVELCSQSHIIVFVLTTAASLRLVNDLSGAAANANVTWEPWGDAISLSQTDAGILSQSQGKFWNILI